jgi:hypothetical protein
MQRKNPIHAAESKNLKIKRCKKICPCTFHAGTWVRGRTAPFILYLDINCQFHAPSGLPRKEFPNYTHSVRGWVGTRTGWDALENRNISFGFLFRTLFSTPAGKIKFMFSVLILYRNTECPTRYRTGHFFNNSNTNGDIATKFEEGYVRCVRNEEECDCNVCL